jgi:hypothetical protein
VTHSELNFSSTLYNWDHTYAQSFVFVCIGINCPSAPPDKTSTNLTNNFVSSNPPDIGENITYTCKSGHYFASNRSLTAFNVTCLNNNVYTGPLGYTYWPSCVKTVICSNKPDPPTDPDMMYNYNPTKVYLFNSTVR